MKNIYMVGICGTGMGNLALMLKEQGYNVTGSDSNIYPPMSTVLENAGIKILKGYDASNIKQAPDLAIIGNVVRRDNAEAQHIINNKIEYLSMPQALRKFFFDNKETVVVTGTHGKTTTSFMTAWLLETANLKPGFFIGGVPKDFSTMGRPAAGNNFVIEGDEYDTAFFDKEAKFFHYNAKYLIINCIEFDHADIYPDLDSIKKAFAKLVKMIPEDGVIIYNADDKNVLDIIHHSKAKTVSFAQNNKEADVVLMNTRTEHSKTQPKLKFEIKKGTQKKEYELIIPGLHNAINATAVIALAYEMGIDDSIIKKAFSSFNGVKRRQDVYGISGGRIIIDDFAHHPTAIEYSINAITDWYSPRDVWCLYEPRSATSRTNILQPQMIHALSNAKHVLLAPVNQPERVAEEKRFNPKYVSEQLLLKGVDAHPCGDIDSMVKHLVDNTKEGDVILIMSNGGFGGIYQKLMEAFKV